MTRRTKRAQAGFLITLELVLIFTILGLGLLVGIVAIRNALFKYFLNRKSEQIWVYDSGTPSLILGRAFDMDEHETPRLFYIDRDVAAFGGGNFRAVIGVRDDRFTSRNRIYYTNTLDCGATDLGGGTPGAGDNIFPCITAPSDEDADNVGVGKVGITVDVDETATLNEVTTIGRIDFAGGQSYLHALQPGGPSYGIGADIDQTFNSMRLPGTLYRQTPTDCTDPGVEIRSMWTSQTVTSGESCEALPAGVVVTAAKCPPGADGVVIGSPCDPGPNVDSRCVTAGTCSGGLDDGFGCANNNECPGGACIQGTLQCACPFTANGNDADDWEEIGSNCCPPGTDAASPPGQCIIGTDGVMFRATPVLRGDGSGALSIFTPPFNVNLPLDTSDLSRTAPPATEGGPPGPVTGPYDPSAAVDYDVAPAGEDPPL